jgi:hypothetical protein
VSRDGWKDITVRKQCAVCPAEFEAKRASARYCSERCKKRAQRSPDRTAAAAQPGKAPELPGGLAELAAGGLLAATEAKLSAAGRLDGPEGQAALILAARISMSPFSAETGASVAALVRQLHATLAEALAGAKRTGDPVEDELRTARERRRALAGG